MHTLYLFLICKHSPVIVFFSLAVLCTSCINYKKSKTRQHASFSKHENEITQHHSFAHCTGYLIKPALTTNCPPSALTSFLARLLLTSMNSSPSILQQDNSVPLLTVASLPFHTPKPIHTDNALFTFCAPTQWNSLPFHIRHSQSPQAFKRALKTHLFKKYNP
ncbi:hypothetical protein V1264_001596 [Littorina saxatilis]|uniref:Uncharacterized protein n=1 Tax=Littorina saxatilis TaxID=31220 RepID=A0AAN9BZS2_9CAEN